MSTFKVFLTGSLDAKKITWYIFRDFDEASHEPNFSDFEPPYVSKASLRILDSLRFSLAGKSNAEMASFTRSLLAEVDVMSSEAVCCISAQSESVEGQQDISIDLPAVLSKDDMKRYRRPRLQ